MGNTVQAGLPTEVGDVFADEYTMLPRSLARCGMIVCLPVRGDSMEDCGILEGDTLSVQIMEGFVVFARGILSWQRWTAVLR